MIWMDTSEKYRKKLEMQMNAAEKCMEHKRAELSEIMQAIKADPSRTINDDPKAWKKNEELSRAIQKYMRLENALVKIARIIND